VTLVVSFLAYAYIYVPAMHNLSQSFLIGISPGQLHIAETSDQHRRKFVSSPEELLELRLVSAKHAASHEFTGPMPADGAILARSESDSITFGHGLTDEELGWLKAVIEQVLAAGADGGGEEAGDRDPMVDDE
jgi:hypothetical protein